MNSVTKFTVFIYYTAQIKSFRNEEFLNKCVVKRLKRAAVRQFCNPSITGEQASPSIMSTAAVTAIFNLCRV